MSERRRDEGLIVYVRPRLAAGLRSTCTLRLTAARTSGLVSSRTGESENVAVEGERVGELGSGHLHRAFIPPAEPGRWHVVCRLPKRIQRDPSA